MDPPLRLHYTSGQQGRRHPVFVTVAITLLEIIALSIEPVIAMFFGVQGAAVAVLSGNGLPLMMKGGIYQQASAGLSLLERASFLRHTFLGYGSGFLEVDCAEVARDKGQVGR
jgi:hypothetical protein